MLQYNVFKKSGFKNERRNNGLFAGPLRFPGCDFFESFEAYLDYVETHDEENCFRPFELEVTGLNENKSVKEVCKFLATETCHNLVPLLDGEIVVLEKCTFTIHFYQKLVADRQAAVRCMKRMLKTASPYFVAKPLFDNTFPVLLGILENSVKISSFSQEKKEYSTCQVQFDLAVRLKNPVPAIELEKMKKPVHYETTKRFYNLAKTLNSNLGKFYFQDQFHSVVLKNDSEEASDTTFLQELIHDLGNQRIASYVETLLEFTSSREWREKLEFWCNPEKYDFIRRRIPFYMTYEVPNRTCSNTVSFRADCLVPQLNVDMLKNLYTEIEEKTIQMISERRSFSTQSIRNLGMNACIRDVRTIQSLQEHCLYVYNAIKNLYDYMVQNAVPHNENFIEHMCRLAMERIKLDPISFLESSNSIIKKYATTCVSGGLYGG